MRPRQQDRRLKRTAVIGVLALVVLALQWLEMPDFAESSDSDTTVTSSQAASMSGEYTLDGQVVEVTDGDTLVFRVRFARDESGSIVGAEAGGAGEGTIERIRLASVDAPERTTGPQRPGQPFSRAAWQFLNNRVNGHSLTLACYEQDPYGRHICDVPDPADEGATVNQSLVRLGLAWANMEGRGKFLRDASLTQLQALAKSERLGLWGQPDPVAPWVWRYQCWRNGECG